MLIRQLFDNTSFTYTYLLASGPGSEALIIDPVIEKTERYLQLLAELDLKLVKAIDTHLHADHISALGALRDKTKCVTVMGKQSSVDVVSMRVDDGDKIEIDGIDLEAIYTPGHTIDSYCFYGFGTVFTGDTLLIRGSGRTDFQNGDPGAAYDSIFNKLLRLPDQTLVYPGHDYRGETVSTIGEEKAFNPRLKVRSKREYIEIMDNLDLPDPKLMDVAVPANLEIGLIQDEPEIVQNTIQVNTAKEAFIHKTTIFVDLREEGERRIDGVIPRSLHLPYVELLNNGEPEASLLDLSMGSDKHLILYCAYGERSALALKEFLNAGCTNITHLAGGIDAWISSGGPIAKP